MEQIFRLDRWFMAFLLAVTLFFILMGVVLNSAQWVPADYAAFL